MHTNSLDAYSSLSAHLNKRERIVYDVYVKYHPTPLSDKFLMNELGEADPNRVRPRITDLKAKNLIRETGRMKCQHTGSVCRHCGLVGEQKQAELDLSA